MDNPDPNENLIQRLVHQLTAGKQVHICIHTMSGIFFGNKAFEILRENTIHSSVFCNTAKKTKRGLHCCMMNKVCSIKKAIKLAHTYVGRCYLGLTEIVSPVFYDGRPFCIIYVGNLLVEDNIDDFKSRIKKMSKVTGINEMSLLEKLGTVEKVNAASLEYYINMAGILSSVVRLCISNSIANHKRPPDIQPGGKSNIHWIVTQVINHIESYYSSDINLAMIAKLYNMNGQYLCRLFKREMGENFSDYLNRIRVEKAGLLLAQTGKSITEIAFSVGFNSTSYFSTVFKKLMAYTPQKYRKIQSASM